MGTPPNKRQKLDPIPTHIGEAEISPTERAVASSIAQQHEHQTPGPAPIHMEAAVNVTYQALSVSVVGYPRLLALSAATPQAHHFEEEEAPNTAQQQQQQYRHKAVEDAGGVNHHVNPKINGLKLQADHDQRPALP